MRPLKKLYAFLIINGNDNEAKELRQLMKEQEEDMAWLGIENESEEDEAAEEDFKNKEKLQQSYKSIELLEGQMPNFNWLLKGNIFKSIYNANKKAFLEFLDDNSHILLEFNSPQYLASGMMADTWVVDDKVLKIFDINSRPGGSKPQWQTFKEMYDKQWHGISNKEILNMPMIYGMGKFESPDMVRSISTNNFSRGPTELAWILMEKFETINNPINRYIKDSGTDLQREVEIEGEPEDDLDDWEYTEENPNFKMQEIYDVFNDNYMLKELAKKKLGGDAIYSEPEELIKIFIPAFIDSIQLNILSEMDDQMSDNFGSKRERKERKIDINNPEELKKHIYKVVSNMIRFGDESEILSMENLSLVERILGVNRKFDMDKNTPNISAGFNIDWIVDIAYEGAKNILDGNADIHSGNFGYRKEKTEDGKYKNRPIFFDA